MNIRIINNCLWSDRCKLWGDYWVIKHLEASFTKLGHTIIDLNSPVKADFNLYLAGGPFSATHDRPATKNVVWFYSHVNEKTMATLNKYDCIFTLNDKTTNYLQTFIKKHIMTMYGCTHIIPPTEIPEKTLDVVMVANARINKSNAPKLYGRPIIEDLDPIVNNIKLNLWGYQWDLSPRAKRYIRGLFTDNMQLNKLYGSAKIVLNDSSKDMIDNGFITIRTYDAVASGALCVSAPTKGLDDIFNGAVVTYDNKKDLIDKVKYYLAHDDKRNELIQRGMDIIRSKNLTYDKNASFIIHVIKNHL